VAPHDDGRCGDVVTEYQLRESGRACFDHIVWERLRPRRERPAVVADHVVRTVHQTGARQAVEYRDASGETAFAQDVIGVQPREIAAPGDFDAAVSVLRDTHIARLPEE